MRQALIYNQDQLAGLLTEDENGYTFQYDTATLNPAMRNLSASHCQSRKSHIQV